MKATPEANATLKCEQSQEDARPASSYPTVPRMKQLRRTLAPESGEEGETSSQGPGQERRGRGLEETPKDASEWNLLERASHI